MRKKPLLAVALALGIWQLAAVARAQQDDLWPETQQPPQQEKTLWGRLSDFGQSVFGAPSASRPSDNATRPAPQPVAATSPGNVPAGQPPATASPGTGQMTPGSRIAGADLPDAPPAEMPQGNSSGRPDTPSDSPPASESWPRYTSGDSAAVGNAPQANPPVAAGPSAPSTLSAPSTFGWRPASSAPESSLHERLQGFRESVFGDNSPKKAEVADPAPAAPPATSGDSAGVPAGNQTPTLAPPRPTPRRVVKLRRIRRRPMRPHPPPPPKRPNRWQAAG